MSSYPRIHLHGCWRRSQLKQVEERRSHSIWDPHACLLFPAHWFPPKWNHRRYWNHHPRPHMPPPELRTITELRKNISIPETRHLEGSHREYKMWTWPSILFLIGFLTISDSHHLISHDWQCMCTFAVIDSERNFSRDLLCFLWNISKGSILSVPEAAEAGMANPSM